MKTQHIGVKKYRPEKRVYIFSIVNWGCGYAG